MKPPRADHTLYYGDLFTLKDAVQTLSNTGKTGSLEIKTENKSSYMFFLEGQLIDAVHGERRGIEAVFSLLRLPKTATSFKAGYRHPYRTIDQPTIGLLLESARRIDEGTDENQGEEEEDGVPTLQILSGDQIARTFRLERELFNVGRSLENDIVIADPSISRFHARLEVHDFGVIVRDLGSRNGTWLLSRRICDAMLEPDDGLHFGLVPARFIHRDWIEFRLSAGPERNGREHRNPQPSSATTQVTSTF